MVVLPVVAFAFALRNSDVNQASFYWNIACFFNTTFLAVVVFKTVSVEYFKAFLRPTFP